MRVVREHNDRMVLAYTLAALMRHKTLPKAETLFVEDEIAADKPKQSTQDMIDAAIFITQLAGGKVHYRGERLH